MSYKETIITLTKIQLASEDAIYLRAVQKVNKSKNKEVSNQKAFVYEPQKFIRSKKLETQLSRRRTSTVKKLKY